MPILKRAGRLLLQLAVFLVLMTVLSKAITHVTAERYTPGVGEPNRLFPVVALQSAEAGAAGGQYRVLRWGNLRGLPPSAAPRFRLPAAEGEFTLPPSGGFEPFVRFSAADEVDGRQRVSVTLTEDDYVLYSTYLTDGTILTPLNFRIWGPSSMLLALIPAVVLTWALGRLAAWWWRRRKQAAPQG
jgi:hypothetical protein